MSLTLDFPQDQEETLRAAFGPGLAQATKEALAIEGYRQEKLSLGEVQDILGLSTRHEVETLFAARGVRMNYSLDDLNADRKTLNRLLGIHI
jgi:predicted HTH domain antitoxin